MSSQRALIGAERSLFVAAALLAATWLAATLDGTIARTIALRAFDDVRADAVQTSDQTHADIPDFTLWDPRRVEAYRQSLLKNFPSPMAVLTGDPLRGRVPIFEGTDDAVLNRGAGWVVGTSRPGERGNVGVAGHRDGVFRALKDVAAGDRLELQTPDRTLTYTVDEIKIVDPRDVYVLAPRERPTLTLITCYPFYYVGSAPQRYVVHASLIDAPSRTDATSLTPVPHADLEEPR